MSVRYVVDSNVLIRFLTGEPPAMAEQAKAVVAKAARGEATLEVFPMTVAEVVYSLEGKVYAVNRKTVVDRLQKLLEAPGFKVHEKSTILDALSRHRDYNISFPDCYFAAVAKEGKTTVLSFDTDFDRFTDVERTPPESA